MFDYFKLKIDLSPFSLLYKVGAYLQRVMLLELRLLLWIQRSLAACSHTYTVGWGVSLRLWQLAERKDFESDMTLGVMKPVKHLLYFTRKHQVILPSSCLCLLIHTCKKAGSTSMLRPAHLFSLKAPRDSENSQGLESGDQRICLGSGISSL